MSNITVDRSLHFSGRKGSTDSFACETKSPAGRNEPTTKNGWQTNGIFHTIADTGATFIFFSDIDIPRGTDTWVNASDVQGNIVSRSTVPNSVAQGYLTGGFGKSAHGMDQAAHDFSFTLNQHVVWSCDFSSSLGASLNWFDISGSTLLSGEAGCSSTWRGARLNL